MSAGLTGLAALDSNAMVYAVWGPIVIVVILLGGAGVLWLRKRLLGRDAPGDGGFASLETMRQQGLVTEEELRAIRRKMVDRQAKVPEASGGDPGGTRPAEESNLTPEADLTDLTQGDEQDSPPKDSV